MQREESRATSLPALACQEAPFRDSVQACLFSKSRQSKPMPGYIERISDQGADAAIFAVEVLADRERGLNKAAGA